MKIRRISSEYHLWPTKPAKIMTELIPLTSSSLVLSLSRIIHVLLMMMLTMGLNCTTETRKNIFE